MPARRTHHVQMSGRLAALHLASPPPPTLPDLRDMITVVSTALTETLNRPSRSQRRCHSLSPVVDSSATNPGDGLDHNEGDYVARRQMRILCHIQDGIATCQMKLSQPRNVQLYLELRGRVGDLRTALRQLTRQVPLVQSGKSAAIVQINGLEEELHEWNKSLGPHVRSIVFDSGK